MGGNPGNRIFPLPPSIRVHGSAAIEPSTLNVRGLLREYGLDPHKGLGQNFLVDQGALKKIVLAAEISKTDHVLEIGAGLGSLTRVLAASAGRVTAVEIDKKLIPVLTRVVSNFPNVEVVPGDILELKPDQLVPGSGYVVVANIPYYITSAIIRHLLESPVMPSRLVLTMQKEVAQRICAEPGDLSLLAISVQVFGTPRIVTEIPASAFYPSPKVDSATLRVDVFPEPFIPERQRELFFSVVKMGFSQKRKMLRNTLAAGLRISNEKAGGILSAAGIDPQRRAQTLDLVEWRTLLGEVEGNTPVVGTTE